MRPVLNPGRLEVVWGLRYQAPAAWLEGEDVSSPRNALPMGLVWLLGLLLLGPGCRSAAANRIDVVPEGNASITVNNPGLHDECEIVSGRALYEGDVLLGVVMVRSHEDHKQTLEYRWTFVDSDGVVEESGTGQQWRTTFVNGLEDKQLTGRATEPGAVRGAFELRYHSGVTDADN